MTEPRICPVVPFDHNSPEHSADPVAAYARLRAEAPVAWTEAHGGFWVLSDYDAVFEAARDDAVFSSGRSSYGGKGLNNVIPKAPVRLHIPVELDLPEHRSYRKILNPVTSPAAVARAAADDRALDDVVRRPGHRGGECDFAGVIGVPAVVTLDWLGLDVGDWRRYSRALHSVLADSPGSPAHTHAVEVDIPWMEEQITAAIAARRAQPRDDLISYLLAQDVDGAPISDDAAYSVVELLISGGVGTTASLVSQTLVHLSAAPRPAAAAARGARSPVAGGRGVPARVLADPGPRAHRHAGHRLPWLPDEEGRSGAPGLELGQPRPRTVRGPGRRRPHAVAEPAHRVRHGHPPVRRRPRRARDRPRAHRAGDPPDAGLRRRRRGAADLPAPGRQRRLPTDPGDLHPRTPSRAGLG